MGHRAPSRASGSAGVPKWSPLLRSRNPVRQRGPNSLAGRPSNPARTLSRVGSAGSHRQVFSRLISPLPRVQHCRESSPRYSLPARRHEVIDLPGTSSSDLSAASSSLLGSGSRTRAALLRLPRAGCTAARLHSADSPALPSPKSREVKASLAHSETQSFQLVRRQVL